VEPKNLKTGTSRSRLIFFLTSRSTEREVLSSIVRAAARNYLGQREHDLIALNVANNATDVIAAVAIDFIEGNLRERQMEVRSLTVRPANAKAAVIGLADLDADDVATFIRQKCAGGIAPIGYERQQRLVRVHHDTQRLVNSDDADAIVLPI